MIIKEHLGQCGWQLKLGSEEIKDVFTLETISAAERAACWYLGPAKISYHAVEVFSGLPGPAENAETNGNERHVP